MNIFAEGLRPPDELTHHDFDVIVRRLADDLAFGTDASRFVGPGIEFAQSRPYVPGDPIRSMDWKVTGRTGKLHVKEYEALKRITAYLVVDTSTSMSVGSTDLTKHDVAIWAAAAVGLLAIRRFSPASVIAAGSRNHRAQPTLSRNEFYQSLEPLRVGRFRERTCVGETLDQLMVLAPRNSLVLVLSDLHEDGVIDAIKLANQRHDVMVIQLHDPSETGDLRAGFVRAAEAETDHRMLIGSRTRIHADRLDRTTREMSGAGIDHAILRTDESMIPILRNFLGDRPTGRMARS